ncbi:hypothetical protein EMPS_07934 [Entomortierella parvispora]|uniref:Uncharacterized protein n=1 Tax=Entomortierella parvispora TaxID=205924 RepID=A0A9P3HF26_9FUNG|nr:hypothetical protein EMPS_07934 [Entomortierella parvispora]
MGKDMAQSTSSSNRYSINGSNILNNNINTLHDKNSNRIVNSIHSDNNNSNSRSSSIPLQPPKSERAHSPDLEASYGPTSRSRKSKTPSPPLSPGSRTNMNLLGTSGSNGSGVLLSSLPRRWTKKPCLLIGLGLGLLLPIWIFTTGVITLDSFNDVIRYLPGYHIFANNLLYLVMFLLFVSFTILATMPILPIYLLGLPFHLLIFSIFNRLMSDWLWWCIGSYTILFLAPFGTWILARTRRYQQERNGRRDLLIRHNKSLSTSSMSAGGWSGSPTPSLAKYSPLNINSVNNNNNNNNHHLEDCSGVGIDENGNTKSHHSNNNSPFISQSKEEGAFSGSVHGSRRTILGTVGQRLEYAVQLLSKTNHRTSIRWRLLLAWTLVLSYVIPVTMRNESRIFDPNRAVASFDIQHPEPLCSPQVMRGAPPARHQDFEGYWQDYLQFHRTMVLPERQGGVAEKDKKFLIFQPSDDGLGNRLQALLSSVVLAMVSRRAIILDWVAMPQCNANFTDLFQHPKDLSWDLSTTLPLHKDDAIFKKKPEIWYPYCRNCALRSAIGPDSTWSNLLCEGSLFGLPQANEKYIQILSTHWFLPVIQHNPHYRQELCQMFPEGGKNAFEILAKKLLRPSREVQRKVDSVLERIPKDATLIGLQVRRTENNAVGQGIENSFLSCAQQVVEEEDRNPAGLGTTVRARQASMLHLSSSLGEQAQGSDNLSGEKWSMVQEGHQPSASESSSLASRAQEGGGSFTKKYAFYLATDFRPTRVHFQEVLGDQLYVLENTFESHQPSSPFSNSPQPGTGTGQGSGAGDLVLDDEDQEFVGDILSSSEENELAQDIELSDLDSKSRRLPSNVPTLPLTGHGANGAGASGSSVSETEAVVRNSVGGVQTAVAEMFLLAQADRIISSPYSTFGYFAHGYANVQPNIVKRDGTCIFRKSTQPCFQYWFGFANGGAKCSIRSTLEMAEDYDCWL